MFDFRGISGVRLSAVSEMGFAAVSEMGFAVADTQGFESPKRKFTNRAAEMANFSTIPVLKLMDFMFVQNFQASVSTWK